MFLRELDAAVDRTHRDDEKFARFAAAFPKQSPTHLRELLGTYRKTLNSLVTLNKTEHRYGFARLDAFGHILNAICATGLEIPDNGRAPDAPVSYPFLWDTPDLDWVQWNSSTNDAVARNVGEVLGVFGWFNLKAGGPAGQRQFDSTVRLKELLDLEDLAAQLQAPEWPADLFGSTDPSRVALGKTLFATHCAACHGVRGDDGKFPQAGGRISTKSVLFSDIGTDPQMIMKLGIKVAPGALAPHLDPPVDPAGVLRVRLMKVAVLETAKRRNDIERLKLDFPVPSPPPNGFRGYKARPLNGIWATAPFLHNGSVPTLDDLLKPSSGRPNPFWLGSRKFDPVKVGFDTKEFAGGFEFKTENATGPIPGNSNRGHEGKILFDGKEYGLTQTLDNGVWRDFTDAERLALIEYMKTLK